MIEEFKKTIWEYTAHPTNENVKVIKVMPNKSVAIKKEMLKNEESLKVFLRGIQNIPNINKGISYLAMQDIEGFPLNKNETLIIVAIGVAMDLWESSPMNIEDENMRNLYVEQDTFEMLPHTVGYSVQNAMAKLHE
jgi:hypothetical protein